MITDPKNRDYACQENNYILNLLFKAPLFKGEEEQTTALAIRNVSATENCFGKSDRLHIMALNTLGYVYSYRENDFKKALDTLSEADKICRANNLTKEELFLETSFLLADAKIKDGRSPVKSILERFSNKTPGNEQGEITEAAELLSEQLSKAAFGVKLKQLLLMIALRDVAVALWEFATKKGNKKAATLLENNLQLFLNAYY